jgi:hypothetical protein
MEGHKRSGGNRRRRGHSECGCVIAVPIADLATTKQGSMRPAPPAASTLLSAGEPILSLPSHWLPSLSYN